MFCVVFAAIGIPLTIVFFKNIGKLVSLPFEKLGNCLKHKGISEVSSLSFSRCLHTITHTTHTQNHTQRTNTCTYLVEKFCFFKKIYIMCIYNLRLTIGIGHFINTY